MTPSAKRHLQCRLVFALINWSWSLGLPAAAVPTPAHIEQDQGWVFRLEQEVVSYSSEVDLRLPLGLLDHYQLSRAAEHLQSLYPAMTTRLLNKTSYSLANVSDISNQLQSTLQVFMDSEFRPPDNSANELVDDIRNTLPQFRRRRQANDQWEALDITPQYQFKLVATAKDYQYVREEVDKVLAIDLPTDPAFNWRPHYTIRSRRDASSADAEDSDQDDSDQDDSDNQNTDITPDGYLSKLSLEPIGLMFSA